MEYKKIWSAKNWDHFFHSLQYNKLSKKVRKNCMRILSLLSPLKGLSQIMSDREKYTLIYVVEEGDTFRFL